MIARILFGLVLCAIGYFIVWKPLLIQDLVGSIAFAEKWFGNSITFFKVVGILIIMIGFLAITNLHGKFLGWVAGFIT